MSVGEKILPMVLQKENTRQKNIPARNIPTDLFRR
jgi:hypothetical protein